MRSLGFALAISAGSFVVPVASVAHHSIALYSNEVIELEGQLARIDWQNPHIKFELSVSNPDGTEKRWDLESSSIFLRQQDGVTRELFHLGDKVKVAGRRSTRNASALLATNMLLPDGREARLWPQAKARFVDDEKLIKGESRQIDAATENRGIFRVWLPPLPGALSGLPYKAAAVAARQDFDLLAFARRCEPEGMPRIMHTNAFPRELIDRGSEITLRTELFDTVRTIHMDRSEPPAGEPASRLGYSVGAWEGGVLVVRTTLIDWPFFDSLGTPQSENVEITERFTLSEDQQRLDLEMTIVDSSTFESPAVVRAQWQPFDGAIQRYDCQAER